MNTLELKDLKNYLGTGLKFMSELDKPFDEYGDNPIWTSDGVQKLFGDYCATTIENNDAYPIHKCVFAFHPLADLTKPCLEGGKIPIVELAKMSFMYDESEMYNFEKQYVDGEFVIAECGNEFRVVFDGKSFWQQSGCGNIRIANNQHQLFEQLYSWHFWLGDQTYFEKGIIVDINSLDQEK